MTQPTQRGLLWMPLVFIVIALIAAAGVGYVLVTQPLSDDTTTQCTLEARVCADGTAVGRTGPNCEFAACPATNTNVTTNETVDWETFENAEYGYSIRYPSEYILSGTTERYVLRKSPVDAVIIYSLTSDNHQRLEDSEFDGAPGWYDWARAGFPNDGSAVARLYENKREIPLGDNRFTVVNYDSGSGWGGAASYYLVTDATVFLIIGDHGVDNIEIPFHERIVETFTLTTSDPTADWKTYTNTKIGYTIKLPPEWNLVSEYDGRTLPFQGNNDMASFQDTTSTSPDISLIIQACSTTSPYSCAFHSMTDWKTQSGFVSSNDSAFAVSGFEVGRTSNGTGALDYLRENQKYFIHAYPSKTSEQKVQTILSSFTFTK